MTDKMRCVFCGTELENDPNMWGNPTDFWYCPNEKCVAPEQDIHLKVWQALISGKKAQEELECAKNIIKGLFATTAKLNIDTTYKKYLAKSKEESAYVVGDYREDAAQWLFDKYGIWWKDGMEYLSKAQKLEIMMATKGDNE